MIMRLAKRSVLTLFVLAGAIFTAEHVFQYGDLTSDIADWMEDHGLPLPETNTVLDWIVMAFLGAIVVFGFIQSILKIMWVTCVSLLVSLAIHFEADRLSDLTDPLSEHAASLYKEIHKEVRSLL